MANKSIKRGSEILSLFSVNRPLLGTTEIAKAIKTPKTTAHNLIQGLVSAELLEKDKETGKFRLGLKLYSLASTMVGSTRLYRASREIIKRVAIEHDLTARLVIWDDGSLLPLVECQPNVVVNIGPALGARGMVYCTAGGLLLLSFKPINIQKKYLRTTELLKLTDKTVVDPEALLIELEEIKAKKWAASFERVTVGRGAVAAPITNMDGEVIAAVALNTVINRFDGDGFDSLKNLAIQTALSISQGL